MISDLSVLLLLEGTKISIERVIGIIKQKLHKKPVKYEFS